MGKRASNFKGDTLKLISKLPAEWGFAFLLGTLPIWVFSKTSKDFEEMVSGLLAIGPLIEYFGWMLIPYGLLFVFKYVMRFGSDWGTQVFGFFHKLIAEVGTGLLTITRTGLGAAAGIFFLSDEVVTLTQDQMVRLCWMIGVLTLANCALAMLKDEMIEKTSRPTYKNPIKL
ncbi:hypothetical protein [Pseudomonas sp. COR18]|uniref:hypothetical protein n=1 Tax=Pseudomonas sp. COR18 TaxID=3399680 RepID=UPI003AFFFBF5